LIIVIQLTNVMLFTDLQTIVLSRPVAKKGNKIGSLRIT